MTDIALSVGWIMLFALVGGVLGIGMVLLGAMVVPHLMNRLTPTLDEEKEIARGNVAVAEYFGRVASACILGLSIVVAAAVVGGIIAGH